ncbi:MAG: type II secretion system protein [Gallionella sp.]|nr:MAG: type II secretion system protein [Gallionella sp.]
MRLTENQIGATGQENDKFFGAGARAWPPGSRAGDNRRGFTLVELVMVLVIVGIIATVAAPRFFDNTLFQSRGFADQVQASLRYAQKIAIAQRRFACVAFPTSGSIVLTTDVTAACAPGTDLPSLSGGASYVINAPSGITFAAAPANFSFDALGKPSVGQTIAVNGATGAIIVEAETGYVHQ